MTASAGQAQHLPMLLLVGLAVVFGTIGAKVFQKLRVPQVVGYIVIGLVLGRSGLGVFDAATVQSLQPFSFFALGIIGFMIGGELRIEAFRRYGRSFLTILLSEGLGAFIVVSILTTGISYLSTRDVRSSVALGVLLGAICSATAPAATVDVLWEYKTRGILTTTVLAIVALDDGLALMLYALASVAASAMVGAGGASNWQLFAKAGYELFGAAALGTGAGLVLNLVLRRIVDKEKTLPFVIGSVAVVIGAARVLGVDLILSTMSLGMLLSNLAPRRSGAAFRTVESVSTPIYVLFFVLVGARLHVSGMSGWLWVLAVAYVLGRTAGKMVGAYLGARWGRAAQTVRKYLGLCLFSQAGVAIGLAILCADRFAGPIGTAVVTIVTATTLLVQIIGPPCVKLAVRRAGEVGLNVTEEDLLSQYKVADMVDRSAPTLTPGTPMSQIVRLVGQTDEWCYPVIDEQHRLLGVVTLEDLRRVFIEEQLPRLLVAYDIMSDPPASVPAEMPLQEAVAMMQQQELEYVPVVERPAGDAGSDQAGRLAGILELRAVRRRLSQELIRRRRQADEQPDSAGTGPAEA